MKKVFYVFMLMVFASSCKKEKPDTSCLDGRITWTGDFSVDGTSWVLIDESDSQNLKSFILKDLSSEFMVDGLQVNACIYKTSEKVLCYCGGTPYYYKIQSIKKR